MSQNHPQSPPAAAPAIEMKFDYSFCIWPNETQWFFKRSTFDLFKLFPRVEMTFTEREFQAFTQDQSHCGLTLREIERRPHHEWSTV